MERPGLCAVCGRVAEPTYTCKMCGAMVCSEHFIKDKGICARCLSGTLID